VNLLGRFVETSKARHGVKGTQQVDIQLFSHDSTFMD